VLKTAEDLKIEFNQKNVSDPGVREELLARGGKVQMPYLVDEEKGTEMYESDDIIAYLHQRFA
jgi:glutathione S-transferase